MDLDVVPGAGAVAGSPAAPVPNDRPWRWLTAGWRDLMAVPQVGVPIGLGLAGLGWALFLLLLGTGQAWAMLPASAGFFLVAPLLGAGLYEASRLLEKGERVTLMGALKGGYGRNPSQLAMIGVALLILHLFWVRTAGLLFALFFGIGFAPDLEHLPIALLRSDQLLPFLIVGTGAGAILATAVFMISAVSIPMLVDKPELSALEAMVISIRTVAQHPGPMLFWAALIVVLTAIGMTPFLLGLGIVLPLIGHATWHAYRDLVR